MDVSVFSAKPYDRRFLEAANAARGNPHRLHFIESPLTVLTAPLVVAGGAVCAFVNDRLDAQVLQVLKAKNVRLAALRCAGFNNVDLATARQLEVVVARVPGYSPAAVAEHAVAMILTLNRHIHRAYARVREGNFALDGLLGFDLQQATVGIVGTGKIGTALAKILRGFGSTVLAYDPVPNSDCRALGADYVALDELLARSRVISLHCPLTPQTRHLIDERAIALMQRGVMIVNTSRGAVVDTRAVIAGLKSGAIGSVGLDVYEEEGDLFFENLSEHVLLDDLFARLLTFPNVLITGHQAFFTHEALTAICATTIDNISAFEKTGRVVHEVTLEKMAG